MSPAMRPLYAFAVALVESATTVKSSSFASKSSTRRALGSLTSTRPSDNGRMLVTAPSFSFVAAVTAPSCLMGGRSSPLGPDGAGALCAPALAAIATPARETESALRVASNLLDRCIARCRLEVNCIDGGATVRRRSHWFARLLTNHHLRPATTAADHDGPASGRHGPAHPREHAADERRRPRPDRREVPR